MEATSMTQLLKGFCDGTQWKYAVYWKLNHGFPMTLIWEDGYCSHQKTNEAAESMWGDINFKFPDDLYYSTGESMDDSGDYSAGLLMTEMSHLKYCLGEGVVGKVALAGDHCWVFSEDILTGKFDTNLISECPDEWLLQFASGIKTILLVPVLPQGVLQLGSFEKGAEDLELVIDIKEKFHSIHLLASNNTALNLGVNYQQWSFSVPTNALMDILDESSSVTNSILKGEASGSIALSVNASSTLKPTVSSYDPKHIGHVERKNFMEEEVWTCSHLVNNMGVSGEMSNGFGSYSAKITTDQQYCNTEACYDDVKNVNDFFSFPSESELHKALASASAHRQASKSLSKYISVEDTYSCSTLISNTEEHDCIKGLELPEEIGPEHLLDAVVGSLFSALDDTTSISNSVRSPICKPVVLNSSIHPKITSQESTLITENSNARSDFNLVAMAKGRDDFTNQFTPSSFDRNSSVLVDDEQQEKVYSHMLPTSGPKLSSSGKKRARPSTTQRSRPRDRQLIMDRMKELRDLVPDGGRCSMDNLLERTIKHMLYLRMITNQAEKLKRLAHREVSKCKKQKINYSYPGRSCAFDLKSEQAWPIVIEDLECSGHMLIEMVCDEHGLFLEIAQVIRKLELSILKGVLENRSSAAWACFIVEVPRGFYRMDVLCPLLHLLQLRRNRLI